MKSFLLISLMIREIYMNLVKGWKPQEEEEEEQQEEEEEEEEECRLLGRPMMLIAPPKIHSTNDVTKPEVKVR